MNWQRAFHAVGVAAVVITALVFFFAEVPTWLFTVLLFVFLAGVFLVAGTS